MIQENGLLLHYRGKNMVNVEVYQTKKLNRVDILESLDKVRDECNLITEFNDVTLLTADNNDHVDIDELDNEDMVKISFVIMEDDDGVEIGYYVIDYRKISPTTYRLFLKRAALTTILPNAQIVEAFADRMHVTKEEDNTLYFTALEPFQPCERPYSFDDLMDKRFPTNNYYNILETVVIPPQMVVAATQVNPVVTAGKKFINQRLESIEKQFELRPETRSTNPMLTAIVDLIGGSEAITTAGVSFSEDIAYRKMIPTNLTLASIMEGWGGATIQLGTRWWLEQDIAAGDMGPYPPNILEQLKKSSVINDLRDLGQDNNINGYWAVPIPYIGGVNHTQYLATSAENYGGISNISSTILNMDWEFRTAGALVHNNKCKYAQCMTLTVYNPASGASLTKQPFEISNPTNKPSDVNIKANFYITADLRVSGSPVFKWKWRNAVNESSIPNGNSELVIGANWRQLTVSTEGVSGEYWNQRAINKANERADREMWTTIGRAGLSIGGAVVGGLLTGGAGAGIGATIGNAIGGINTQDIKDIGAAVGNRYYNQAYEIRQQQELLDAKGQIANPVTQFTGSNYSRDLGYNTFFCQYTYWSEKDVQQFDRFLTMFGYKVENKRFETSDFTSRPHFNYVKLNHCIINAPKYNKSIIDEAIEELKQGVRIWHELPNDAAIDSGNKEA